MSQYTPMQHCPYSLDKCAAYDYRGYCAGVVNIKSTPDNHCPFFKNLEQNYEEHCSAINRLIQRGRFDLLDKYHKKELFD